MTEPKEKPKKPIIKERVPKKRTEEAFPHLRQPVNIVDELLNFAPAPTQPNPSQPIPTRPNPSQPIAPERDFNRRANSIERTALPSGMFPGTSKKLYDALYLKTRGAISPARTVQATKRELMRWSGIKSKNTIAVNLQILTASGLIVRQLEIGDHGGSVYEVYLPEEVSHPNPTQPSPTIPDPTQKLGGDPTQLLGWVGMGKTVDSQTTSGDAKTSFKTKTEKDDDEAFATLRKVERELTGKTSKWTEVSEVLATELKIAASRTTVSNPDAFFAEHLRRRLFKKDKRQLEAEGRNAAPVPATAQIDASQCPDCAGVGMWYPEGFEKGVAKCKHERLS
jgi:hypothetical protein